MQVIYIVYLVYTQLYTLEDLGCSESKNEKEPQYFQKMINYDTQITNTAICGIYLTPVVAHENIMTPNIGILN